MKDLRNLDINLFNFISSGLRILDGYTVLTGYNQNWVTSGIYLMDGHPEDFNNIKIPAISIEHEYSREEAFQIGTGKTNVRRFGIDVYARTDGERDDLSELVRNYFDRTIPVINYNDFYSLGIYTYVGLADFDNVVMYPSRDSTIKQLKHRMSIKFDVIVHINTGSSLV